MNNILSIPNSTLVTCDFRIVPINKRHFINYFISAQDEIDSRGREPPPHPFSALKKMDGWGKMTFFGYIWGPSQAARSLRSLAPLCHPNTVESGP